MEFFIQSQFESRVLISPRLFSDKYCMDAWEAQDICKVSNNLLYDVASSREDRKNLSYTNHTELFEHYCKVQAADMGILILMRLISRQVSGVWSCMYECMYILYMIGHSILCMSLFFNFRGFVSIERLAVAREKRKIGKFFVKTSRR